MTHICAFIPLGKIQGPIASLRKGQGDRYKELNASRRSCISSLRWGALVRIKIKSHRLKIESISRLLQQIPLHFSMQLSMAVSAVATSSSWESRMDLQRFRTRIWSWREKFWEIFMAFLNRYLVPIIQILKFKYCCQIKACSLNIIFPIKFRIKIWGLSRKGWENKKLTQGVASYISL